MGIPDNITKLKYLDTDFDSIVAPEMRLKGIQERFRAAAMIRDFYFEQSEITPSLAQSIRDVSISQVNRAPQSPGMAPCDLLKMKAEHISKICFSE